MMLPIVWSLLAETVATCAIIGPFFDFLGEPLDLGDGGFDGAFDAALDGHRIGAGGHGLHAFAEDGLGENGRGGGAVTGNVAGLGGDFLHHLRAHILEGILQFDFLRDGHAVLCDLRRAELLVENNVAALGSQRDLDGVRQQIHPAQNRLPGFFTMYDLFCCHSFSSPTSFPCAGTGAFNDAENLVFAQDQVLLAVQLDFGSRILAEENAVARLHFKRKYLARLVSLAGTGRDNFRFLGLLFRGVGNDDSSPNRLLFFDSLDQYAIMQRSHFHRVYSFGLSGILRACA